MTLYGTENAIERCTRVTNKTGASAHHMGGTHIKVSSGAENDVCKYFTATAGGACRNMELATFCVCIGYLHRADC